MMKKIFKYLITYFENNIDLSVNVMSKISRYYKVDPGHFTLTIKDLCPIVTNDISVGIENQKKSFMV